MLPVFIYALLDPKNGATRYVGQTGNPDERLRKHLRAVKTCYSACWIRSLKKQGLTPVMEILDVVPDTEADFWECEYVQNFRERGFDLTNLADGGSTSRGVKFSPERRAKIKAARAKQIITPESNAKRSKTLKGREFSSEHRAKLSAAGKGRKFTPEHRAKISAARKKLWADKNK